MRRALSFSFSPSRASPHHHNSFEIRNLIQKRVPTFVHDVLTLRMPDADTGFRWTGTFAAQLEIGAFNSPFGGFRKLLKCFVPGGVTVPHLQFVADDREVKDRMVFEL